MMKKRTAVLVVLLLVSLAQTADARWRVFGRRRSNYTSGYTTSSVRYAGGPAEVAATKANILARRGYGGHIGGGYGGANAEGWGAGVTAQAALNRCCFTGQRRLAGSAVVRSSNGLYYAIKLFW